MLYRRHEEAEGSSGSQGSEADHRQLEQQQAPPIIDQDTEVAEATARAAEPPRGRRLRGRSSGTGEMASGGKDEGVSDSDEESEFDDEPPSPLPQSFFGSHLHQELSIAISLAVESTVAKTGSLSSHLLSPTT